MNTKLEVIKSQYSLLNKVEKESSKNCIFETIHSMVVSLLGETNHGRVMLLDESFSNSLKNRVMTNKPYILRIAQTIANNGY